MKVHSILETIGNTPHVKINRLFPDRVSVWMKLERANPGASIKDRIALAMIEDAEKNGTITSDTHIVEPTSGNTGIGLALVAAAKGYKLTLVMPESMSLERRRYLKAMGANLELTPKEQGMNGAINRAKEIATREANAWMPDQFSNAANPEIHRLTTAKEILEDFGSDLDYLITGIGTGGHITGVAEVLKEQNPTVQAFGVEPLQSAVLNGKEPGPHKIQGIGAGFAPEVLNQNILDGVIAVDQDDAFTYAQRCAKEEGIFVGISTGATLAATAQKISDMPDGSTVVIFCYDTGERYLSVDGLFEA